MDNPLKDIDVGVIQSVGESVSLNRMRTELPRKRRVMETVRET